jgi:hypothetical protein
VAPHKSPPTAEAIWHRSGAQGSAGSEARLQIRAEALYLRPVPTIRVMTWNAYGGDTSGLAAAVGSLDIDLVVLQEASASLGAAFYAPLLALAPTFEVAGPFRENQVRMTPSGQTLAPDPGLVRSYAIIHRAATIQNVAASLVDYTIDHPIPSSAFAAAQAGYNQRPPLRITFQHQGRHGVIYNWHAPFGLWTTRALSLFDGSRALANDVASGRLVLIGADMNQRSLSSQLFQMFDGLEEGYDHLLAANATAVRDLRTAGIQASQITLLNNLFSDAHWAVPAEIDYP